MASTLGDGRVGSLRKSATGISGFDEISAGGLPRSRATLVTGPAGSGKSLFAVQFLAHGALEYGENGVLVSFEESPSEIIENAASIGVDLSVLLDSERVAIESFVGDTDGVLGAGSFDLEALFIRVGAAVESVDATRVVLDGIEVLLATLPDAATVRAELGRLLRLLKARDLTIVVTGERGTDSLTRHGIEEYITDSVVVLDHRVVNGVATRSLRIAKYRGSGHSTNEIPFLVSARGFSVVPTRRSDPPAISSERVGLGVPALDDLMGGGVFRGTTTLVTGAAGTGKTSIAAAACAAACERGERALFISLEEFPAQVMRNMPRSA